MLLFITGTDVILFSADAAFERNIVSHRATPLVAIEIISSQNRFVTKTFAIIKQKEGFFMKNRTQTRPVKVQNLQIGHQNRVVIQSMTNSETRNVAETVRQCLELEKLGCEIIRFAVPTMEDAEAIREIKPQIHMPIVADIHFDYRLAIAAIKAGADAVRLNPGNIGARENVEKVVQVCKEYGIPIRN